MDEESTELIESVKGFLRQRYGAEQAPSAFAGPVTETKNCQENTVRWMRAYAMGDRWRYRCLDATGVVLAQGEFGEAAEINDGVVRFLVRLPPFLGDMVRVLCDSPMLGESIEHTMARGTPDDGRGGVRLDLAIWLTAEEPTDSFPAWARTARNSLIRHEP